MLHPGKEKTQNNIVITIFCSLTSCLVEHSLGVVPSLFELCIAHWFTSLSKVRARFKFWLCKLLFFIAIRFGLNPLCCANESANDETVQTGD